MVHHPGVVTGEGGGVADHGYLHALRHPVVRGIWTASSVSLVGDHIASAALMVIAYQRSGLLLGAAAIFAVAAVPALLSGALAGSWLDRVPRKTALAALQLGGAAIVLLPVVIDGLPIVLVTAGLLGAVRAAHVAVRSGAIAEAVPDDRRGPLIALVNSTDQAGQFVGFFAGSGLAVLFTGSWALIIDSVSFVVAALVITRLHLPSPTEREGRPPLTAGLRDIWRNPVLRLLAPLVWITATIGALPEALAAGAADEAPSWTPIVFAAGPAGQAVTMLVLGRLRYLGRPSVQLTHMAWLSLAFGIAALGRTPAWWALANFLVGSGVAWLVGPQLTFVRLAPPERMAQVTGTMIAILVAAEGLGTLAFATLADATSIPNAYRTAGFLVLASALVGWWMKERTPAARALDEERLTT
jgi:MFS family permease